MVYGLRRALKRFDPLFLCLSLSLSLSLSLA